MKRREDNICCGCGARSNDRQLVELSTGLWACRQCIEETLVALDRYRKGPDQDCHTY